MEFKHTSVLLHETIDNLKAKNGGLYVDATFGGGGHAKYLLSKLKSGTLVGFDQDEYAIKAAKLNFTDLLATGAQPHLELVHDNFSHLQQDLVKLGHTNGIDGIYYDLGVSSPQFDQAGRGFSYRFNARLDMRMDQSQELTAYDLVNEASQRELADIFYKYGDEKFSRQIAHRIVEKRRQKPIATTFELVDIIKEAIPAFARRTGGHPAKKSFQALRVAVNHEEQVLSASLKEAIKVLRPGGRISVITFQSHEDKIVKRIFKKYSEVEVPRGMPLIPPDLKPTLKLINRKPITASSSELKNNNRSHSAKLRVAEKVKEE
jgi:16S rRNA (cytosine1402-N4)-methyltransferase